MKIKKIILNNIRSYKNQEIEFPDGSILLSGDIGSGKTSVLLGIEFAFFGLQPGQKGSSLLRNGEDSGGVKMEFEIGNKNIAVERTLKKGKTVSQDYCSVEVNGVKEEISVMELKSRILELIDYPKEFAKKQNLLYRFTVYTPQEEMKQIMLENSETRTNTLRHVFGIDKYKRILENASLLQTKIREEKRLKEALTADTEQEKSNLLQKENELETKFYNLSSVEKELFLKTEIRKKIQDEKDKLSEKIEERKKIHLEIEKLRISIYEKNEQFSGNRKLIGQLENQIGELQGISFDEKEVFELENKMNSLKHKRNEFNETNIKLSSQINSLETKNHENENLRAKIIHMETCPTCLQEVKPIYKNNIMEKINSETNENLRKLKILLGERQELFVKIKETEENVILIEKELQNKNMMKIKYQNLNEKKKRIEELEKRNFEIAEEISSINKKTDVLNISFEDLGKYDKIFSEKQREFEDSIKLEHLAEIKVAELKKEIEFFSKQIDEIKERIKKAEEIKHQLDYITGLENWLSQKFVPLISFIEKNVMTKLKTEFSKLFAEWFLMLVSESFNAKIDDDFSPLIEQQDYEIDYSYLSGGERTAVALAYRLALNQVINSMLSKIKTKDIIVLDEPTDGFSSQQLDKMRDVLNQMNVKQLIIVSHEQKIESFVDNVIRFKKVDGVSVKE
ncbi:MAG: SMC family ATPase [archaeon]